MVLEKWKKGPAEVDKQTALYHMSEVDSKNIRYLLSNTLYDDATCTSKNT